jgi:ABC-type antimicrobial peptide transport system permease subunit
MRKTTKRTSGSIELGGRLIAGPIRDSAVARRWLALGAEPGQLKRMFVGHELALAGAGIVIGLTAAAGLTGLMKSLLFGISTLDAVIYIGMAAVLVAAAVVASYLPARRASRIDPSEALRLE